MPEKSDLQALETAIHVIRGQRVMLDSDLAEIYGVSTKRLLEQYRRNRKRFPKDFVYVLTRQEVANLRSQIATTSPQPVRYKEFAKGSQAPEGSEGHAGGRRSLPVAFTEYGAIQLATVLNSTTAIEASVRVVRAFIHLRDIVAANRELKNQFKELERRLKGHDKDLKTLFDTLRLMIEAPLPTRKEPEMGFHVREEPAIYRVKRRTPKRGPQPSTLTSQLP